MEESLLSRPTIIRDPALGSVFASSKMRRLIMVFAAQSLSVGEAAVRANMDLKRLHYHVQKLVRLGLLQLVSVERRAGRAIKRYRTAASAFFIPDEIMPRPFAQEIAQELRELLQAEAARSSRGLLLTLGPNGEPQLRIVSAEEVSPDAFELWRILKLAPGEVERLRAELDAVLLRYQRTAPARGSVYLVHAAVARRTDASGAADNEPR